MEVHETPIGGERRGAGGESEDKERLLRGPDSGGSTPQLDASTHGTVNVDLRLKLLDTLGNVVSDLRRR